MPWWFGILIAVAVVTMIVIAQGLFEIRDALLKANEHLDELCGPGRERKRALEKVDAEFWAGQDK
jgi:hypothetical protein